MKNHCTTTNCKHIKSCGAVKKFEKYEKAYGTDSAIDKIYNEEKVKLVFNKGTFVGCIREGFINGRN